MNSNTFKTKAGTELPLRNLHGQEYLDVKYRLVWFREEHPDWPIETEIIEMSEKHAVAKAVVKNQDGRILSTGHKHEDKQGFADYREKAETGAIGRALAHIGYGTQFAPDLDEGDRLADSPVDRKTKTKTLESTATRVFTDLSEKQIKRLWAKAHTSQWTKDEVLELLRRDYGATCPEELDRAQYDSACAKLDAPETLEAEVVTPSAAVEAANYVITFGRYKHKRLGEIPLNEVKAFMNKVLSEAAANNGGKVTGVAAEFMLQAEKLVGVDKADGIEVPF